MYPAGPGRRAGVRAIERTDQLKRSRLILVLSSMSETRFHTRTPGQDRGSAPTARLVAKNLAQGYRVRLHGRFDRRYGTDTTGQIEPERLSILGENMRQGACYETTPTRIFEHILVGGH